MTEDRKSILEKEKSVNIPDLDRKMNSPEKVVRFGRYALRIHEETEEYLYMICMNTKLDVTSVFELSHGNVNSSVVGIREMFQKALLANAVNVIVMHNYHSGEVLEHLIIGNDTFFSLKEKGYL